MSQAVRAESADDAPEPNPKGRPPVDRFHEGRVHVSIFPTESAKGKFHTATYQLRYKDKSEQFQTGHSYGRRDCEDLAKAATEAAKRIEELDRPKEQGRSL